MTDKSVDVDVLLKMLWSKGVMSSGDDSLEQYCIPEVKAQIRELFLGCARDTKAETTKAIEGIFNV